MNKQSTPININHPVIPASLVLITFALSLGGESLSELLQFNRDLVINGEIWRMLSGNLVHLGWSHSLLNIMGLLLIWGLFSRFYTGRQWWALIALSFLATTLGLLLLNPELSWYVGLSGSLHGLFIAGCLAEARLKSTMGFIMLIAIVAKLGWEQASGPLPGTSDMAGGNVIVDAHLYGAISGLAALLFKPQLFKPQQR